MGHNKSHSNYLCYRMFPGTVDDYAEAAGRMRIVDFLYREYSLEDIVYQLAKVCNTILYIEERETPLCISIVYFYYVFN